MTSIYRDWRIGTRVVALVIFLISGCASMTSPKDELQNIGDNEGIVVGSVLLTAAQGEANESGMAFLGGRKAGELEYAVDVSKTGSDLFKLAYTLSATPGKEEFFVKKFPAGNYKIDNIRPTGFLAPTLLTFPIGLSFTVKPKETTYIGRLLVTFPHRIRPGSTFGSTIQDAQQETIAKLTSAYPSIMPNTVRALARRDEGPNVVPGDTVASPLLQRDTLTIINVIDGAEDKTCSKRTVVKTESIKKPTRPTDAGEERWTVDRCGKTISYLVAFTPSARGGTDISVKPEK